MLPRVSAVIPLRPLSRLPLCSGGPEASAAAILLLDSLRGTVRYRISALLAPQVFKQPLSPLLYIVTFLRLPGAHVLTLRILEAFALYLRKGKSQKDKTTCPRS